jgi:tetratricopeptide (TPR) repeat protein
MGSCTGRALADKEKALGEHPATLQNAKKLANILEKRGRYDMAEGLHRRSLAGREKALGLEHLTTLQSINNPARVLHRQGQYNEAGELFRQVPAGRENQITSTPWTQTQNCIVGDTPSKGIYPLIGVNT